MLFIITTSKAAIIRHWVSFFWTSFDYFHLRGFARTFWELGINLAEFRRVIAPIRTAIHRLPQYPANTVPRMGWTGAIGRGARFRRLHAISAALCSYGQAQRLMGVRPRREGALAAGVEFTAKQCGVYSRVHFRVLVRVRGSVIEDWCRQRRGCACFPGCAVAKPPTVIGACPRKASAWIPPIARARFGAPSLRRCDALRFLLPLQAVRKTAISQKAQHGRATMVASRSSGCSHTRCLRFTMPRFQGTACSEPRFMSEQT
jgi:hypothetical protein